MNKLKTSSKSLGASRSQHPFSNALTLETAPITANAINSAYTTKAITSPSGTINVCQMAEDADRIREHIVKGGKPDELSGIKFFKPTGLFSE